MPDESTKFETIYEKQSIERSRNIRTLICRKFLRDIDKLGPESLIGGSGRFFFVANHTNTALPSEI